MRVDGLSSDGQPGGDLAPTYRPGVDVAKLMAMFGVVATHVVGYGLRPAPDAAHPAAIRLLHDGLYPVFLAGLDVFAIASGFLGVASRFRASRLVRIWLQMLATGAAMTAFLAATGLAPVTAEDVRALLLPLSNGQWWYMTAYFPLALVAPLLNEGLRRLPRRGLEALLLFTLVPVAALDFCTTAGCLPVLRGYSFQWLLLCYLLGAYLRLHDPLRRLSARAALLGALALAGLSCLGSGLLPHLPAGPLAQVAAKVHFHDFTSPCVIGIAILVFALCQKIPARAGQGGALRTLAAATLGVYLIHVQPCFWSRVFVPRMGALAASSAWDWLARGLGLSLAVFAACLALDLLRARLFALLRLDALCDGLCARVAALVKGKAAP